MTRKITDAEKKAWRADLEKRQTPSQMNQRWHAFHSDIGPEMLVQAGVEFMRDGYVAHRFAEFRGADQVWLVAATRPDFGVLIDGRESLFEVTEADWPERKRSNEYKGEIIPKLRDGSAKVEDGNDLFRMTPSQARELLQRAARDKAAGGYDTSCGLVILLQPGSWSDVEPKVEAVIFEATEVARDAFHEVWVHWGERFYPLWRGGRRVATSDSFP